MKWRVFRGIFAVSIILFILCFFLIYSLVYPRYGDKLNKELQVETLLIARGVNVEGASFLEELPPMDNHRVSLIDQNGIVLFDNKFDPAKLGNHGSRKEVKEAFSKEKGEGSRYSETFKKTTYYYAVKLNNGTVLRLSQTHYSVFRMFLSIWAPLLIALVLAVLSTWLIAVKISNKIVEPINDLDPDNLEDHGYYQELQPLVDKIKDQRSQLNERITKLEVDVNEKTKEADFRREFTANVSHELKTPLTSISGFAEIIKTGIAKEEDIPRFADKIYREAQYLIGLVGDIIKISQLDENLVDQKKTRVDLYLEAKSVLERLEKPAMDMQVSVNLQGEHVYIYAVEKILEEIIYNICENGIKYNIIGGRLTVKVWENEGRGFISVEDTGIGIPQADMERVFERFFRVNKSHSKEIGGTGLGLSIVKHGAAYHNSEIKLESQINKGTKITIVF